MPESFPGCRAPGTPMGQLTRGAARWEVFLETGPTDEPRSLRGRLHFAQGDRLRTSAWIFLESSEQEIRSRLAEFSSIELWRLVESLSP